MSGAARLPIVEDERWMRLALALGRRNLGRTAPNPAVGSVIVAGPPGERRIVAQGITHPGGRPHAERAALDAAGEAARGATLYVSLEPCSHHGHTPPCADAIVASGVARVVSALEDPDARVAGRGHARLRDAGIAVETGVLGEEAWRANRGHITRITLGRPMVGLKLARTADGFAAGAGPERLLITGSAANARVHLSRAHADAIMVGISTVLADDPQLTVRLPGLEERSPLRVILDSRLRTPIDAGVVVTAGRVPTLILGAEGADPQAAARLQAAGAEVTFVPATGDGRLDLRAALATLGARGITRVCSEGGPVLADALARDDLLDTCTLLTGAMPLGATGYPAVGPHLAAALASGHLAPVGEARFGSDLSSRYEVPRGVVRRGTNP